MGTPLVSQIPVEVNNQPVISITKVNAKRSRQVTVKYGPYGAIGAGRGHYKINGTLTLALPKAGLEVDLQALSDSEEGFSLNYPKGAERWACYGCHLSDDELSNTPEAGETEVNLNFVAEEMVRIA